MYTEILQISLLAAVINIILSILLTGCATKKELTSDKCFRDEEKPVQNLSDDIMEMLIHHRKKLITSSLLVFIITFLALHCYKSMM